MYMGRLVRFFGHVGPRGDRWSDIAHAYMTALTESGIECRILPVGGGIMSVVDDEFSHWAAHADWFFGDLSPRYVNVVCAPPGAVLGKRLTGKHIAPTRIVGIGGGEVPAQLLAHGTRAADDVVYEPEFALVQLCTAGHRNIAITSCSPPPSDAETRMLEQYDAVVCPDRASADALRVIGVTAGHYPPSSVREEASLLTMFLDSQ